MITSLRNGSRTSDSSSRRTHDMGRKRSSNQLHKFPEMGSHILCTRCCIVCAVGSCTSMGGQVTALKPRQMDVESGCGECAGDRRMQVGVLGESMPGMYLHTGMVLAAGDGGGGVPQIPREKSRHVRY
ncbi:hypothetical protein LIA77_03419 [Sarocladium implicatum]|nr:hypothetical protein LIA77_03419 [Sarocladium implicatum]